MMSKPRISIKRESIKSIYIFLADNNPSTYDDRKSKDPSKEPDMSDIMHVIRLKGRDNARTPMLWDNSENGGFTGKGVKPWLRLNDEYAEINVEAEERDPDSVLNYFHRLIHIRKQHPLMV